MSDLFGNHIVGFPMRWLNYVDYQGSSGEMLFLVDNVRVNNCFIC